MIEVRIPPPGENYAYRLQRYIDALDEQLVHVDLEIARQKEKIERLDVERLQVREALDKARVATEALRAEAKAIRDMFFSIPSPTGGDPIARQMLEDIEGRIRAAYAGLPEDPAAWLERNAQATALVRQILRAAVDDLIAIQKERQAASDALLALDAA